MEKIHENMHVLYRKHENITFSCIFCLLFPHDVVVEKGPITILTE